ncbi:MAG: cysteine desulfurase, partial [Fuerstiella sp.]|nr:cysteine desulfurase [Fuerstiella sp.]
IVADTLNCEPDEVIFTSGGTESINAAIHGFVAGQRGTIALTAGEHPATTAACHHAAVSGMKLVTIPVDKNGLLETGSLDSLPWTEMKLVAVILAHNETGVIQDLGRLSELCEEHRVPLFVDAVQAVGKIPVDFRALRATAMAFGGHKFHAPRGVGGLLLRRGVSLKPLLEGGHQEAGRRAGTEPVPLIAGMAASLIHFRQHPSARIDRVRSLRDDLQQRLKAGCPPVIVHGSQTRRLPNTLSVAFPGLEGEAMLVNFDLAGIACSLGSTCSSGSAEPAPALLAMGVPPDLCMASVRFSVSCLNSAHEIELAAQNICSIAERMRLTSEGPMIHR